MGMVKVENSSFVRDTNSMGLSNIDRAAKEEYKRKSKEAKLKREEIDGLKEDIKELKSDILEIKNLLNAVLQSNK